MAILDSPVRAGDKITAALFEALRRAVLRCLKLSVGPGLVLTDDARGRHLALAHPPDRWGYLTSAAPAASPAARKKGVGGVVQVYADDGSGSGQMVPGAAGLQVLNPFKLAFPAGTGVLFGVIDGRLTIKDADCPVS